MKLTTVIPILVGGIAVLVALNQGLFKAKEPPKPKYLVATTVIPANQAIKTTYVTTQEWTEPGELPPEYVSDIMQVRGRFVRNKIEKGQPIREDDLWGLGVTSSMMAKLDSDPNMRTFTVKVDDVMGGGGFLKPGNSVDVFVFGELPRGQGSQVVLQGVEVLAVNRSDTTASSSDSSKKGKKKKAASDAKLKHVTLLLTTTQAVKLAAVESQRRVKLRLLMTGKNAKPIAISGATVNEALGIELASSAAEEKLLPVKTQSPESKQADQHVVHVRRGTERQDHPFRLENGTWVPVEEEEREGESSDEEESDRLIPERE